MEGSFKGRDGRKEREKESGRKKRRREREKEESSHTHTQSTKCLLSNGENEMIFYSSFRVKLCVTSMKPLRKVKGECLVKAENYHSRPTLRK